MPWETKPSNFPRTLPQDQFDESWEPDNTHDDYWGADETEYWAQKEAEQKAKAKLERSAAGRPQPRRVTELIPEVIEWKQPSIKNATLMRAVEEARKKPLPVTYTAISSSTDTSIPANKRRLFGNLHRQFNKEIDKATQSGSWTKISPELWQEAQHHASKPVEEWEDMDITLFEPRIRELVKLLITKRREAELM